ncbi:MAG: hypothetical protein OHK0053_12180 [Microscillaceae bacterium]
MKKQLFSVLISSFIFTPQLSAQVVSSSGGTGQVIYFENFNENEVSVKERGSYVSEHPFGEEIRQKLNKIENLYTYEQADAVGAGSYANTKTIVTKKPIYQAIKKLDRHYVKSASKGSMTAKEASKKLDRVLSLGIIVYNQNTAALESALLSVKKDILKLEEVFFKIKLVDKSSLESETNRP